MAYKSAKRRRRKRGVVCYIVVTVILVCAAVAIGLGAFFRVDEIEVEGLTKYDTAEVVEKSGIENGQSLFFLRQSKIAAIITETFSYIEDAQIKPSFPDKATIYVTERIPVAYIVSGEAYWKIDKSCRLLERTDFESAAGLIEIRGIEPVSPSEGKKMSLGAENEFRVSCLESVLDYICEENMHENVGYLDVGNISRITFSYGSSLVINLGSGADLEEKFVMVDRILSDKERGDRGTIDVSDPLEGHFVPE